MLPAQDAYLRFLKAGRTPAMTESAKKADKTSHATLNKLRAESGNMHCFDCTAVRPGWAVLPHGVFVCMECAQIHRHLGRHISQTKAINTNTYLWFDEEIAVMQAVGNERAEQAFADCDLPSKPSRDAPAEEKLAYAKLKYTSGRTDWTRASSTTPVSPAPFNKKNTNQTSTPSSLLPPRERAKTIQMPGAARVTTTPTTNHEKIGSMSVNLPTRPGSPDLIDFDTVNVQAPPPPRSGQTNGQPWSHDATSFFAEFGL